MSSPPGAVRLGSMPGEPTDCYDARAADRLGLSPGRRDLAPPQEPPWSVALRTTALALLIMAFWSRLWLGWWAAALVAVALLWTWLNPRIFPAPQSFDHWASEGVFGERVWLNRDAVPVPARHRLAPNILSAVGGISVLFVAWGVLMFEVWPTLFGAALVYLGKLWFLDRMVWLWHDMRDANAEYRGWLVAEE